VETNAGPSHPLEDCLEAIAEQALQRQHLSVRGLEQKPFRSVASDNDSAVSKSPLFIDAIVIPASGVEFWEDVLATGISFGEGGHGPIFRLVLIVLPQLITVQPSQKEKCPKRATGFRRHHMSFHAFSIEFSSEICLTPASFVAKSQVALQDFLVKKLGDFNCRFDSSRDNATVDARFQNIAVHDIVTNSSQGIEVVNIFLVSRKLASR